MNKETDIAKEIWNDLPDEERRAELSHWRGRGKFKDDKTWLGIGRRSRKHLDFLLLTNQKSWDEKCVVLEWGSGGGANAFALCGSSSAYYGVDIAQKNLDEAQRVCSEAGYSNFHQVLIKSSPNEILSIVNKPIDIFLSTAVFQHFPSKQYGVDVLASLFAACAAGAVGLIQIRYDDGSLRFAGNTAVEQYKDNYVIATTYKIDEFWSLCEDIGFEILCVNGLNKTVKYITFLLKKKS